MIAETIIEQLAKTIKYVKPVQFRFATGLTAEVYRQMQADCLPIPLLTALASYQVDASVVEDFRLRYPDDAQLIATTAWASFTAARRASVWFVEPFVMAGRE
jgi:hypothetical protein